VPETVEVYFDGLCLPRNPGGIACYAYLIFKDGKEIRRDFGLAAEPLSEYASNNVAEYTALIKALEWLAGNGYRSHRVEVKGDSELVVKQMAGEYRIKNKNIVPLFQKAAVLRKEFAEISITWVPREKNKQADRLSEKAYNNVLLDRPELLDRL
jgi:ribonuclease HI